MRFAIIEGYLKGMPEPPETVEGLTKKVNELTAGMRFPPLSDNEMKRLEKEFCRRVEGDVSNKRHSGAKKAKMSSKSSEDF